MSTLALRFPFQIVHGAPLTVEQDSLDEVAQAVTVLLSTNLGERIELPEYGVEDATFSKGSPLEHYRQQVERWAPRALVNGSQTWLDGLDSKVSVQVALVKDPNA